MGGGKLSLVFYSPHQCAPKTSSSSPFTLTTPTCESTKWAHCSASPTTTATPCTCSSAPRAGSSCARRFTSALCRLLTAETTQQQPTRATLNALRLLSRLPSVSQRWCQARQTIQPLGNQMATQHEQERAAVNSALFKLQNNGWTIQSVDDGESVSVGYTTMNKTKQRREAIDEADSVDWATIFLHNDRDDRLGLFIVWGNTAECVISDITASSEAVLKQVEELV